MARTKPNLLDWVVYVPVRCLWWLLGHVPERLAYGAIAACGRLFLRLSRRRQRIALRNLRLAFGPGRPDAELLALARVATGNVLCNLVDMIRLPRVLASGRFDAVVDDSAWLRDGRRDLQGHAFIFATVHGGSWEVGVAYMAITGSRPHVIARRLDNPLLDRLIRRARERVGVHVLPRRGGIKEIVAALRRGEVVGALLDQNQRKRGVFVPLFGRLASTDRSFATFAVRFRLPVALSWMLRVGPRFRFRAESFTVLTPMDTGDHDRDVRELLVRVNQAIERMLLAHPEQYFWIHDRYRTRPPDEAAATPPP